MQLAFGGTGPATRAQLAHRSIAACPEVGPSADRFLAHARRRHPNGALRSRVVRLRQQESTRAHGREGGDPQPTERARGLDQLAGASPLGRPASPEEIAEAIVFLASPRSSYVNGAVRAADGGRTAV